MVFKLKQFELFFVLLNEEIEHSIRVGLLQIPHLVGQQKRRSESVNIGYSRLLAATPTHLAIVLVFKHLNVNNTLSLRAKKERKRAIMKWQ